MKTIQVISSILKIIDPVLNRRNNETTDFPVEFTFTQILERIKFNLESMKVLVENGIAKHDHAIGLISRNLLTDFITTGYIIKLSASDEEIYVKLYALHNSDLKKIDSYLNLAKSAGFSDDTELDAFKMKYSDENHIYKTIRDYCIEFEVKNFPSMISIIELFIIADLKDRWADEIKRSYDIWIFYSKYEHLGWNSYDLTRNTSTVKADERLRNVLFKTSILLGSSLEILKEEKGLTDSIELLGQIYSA